MTALDDEAQQTVFEPPASRPPGSWRSPAPAADASLRAGTLLNHIYEVGRFLARGGMGEVYEGRNVNTDERVAVKVMLPHLAADPKMQALFRKEARILTELAHPALVRYRVLAQEPQLGLLYIVTEFIDGPPLSHIIGRAAPELPALRALGRRLAEGLASAHALGAIHRDMAPDNVLLPGGVLDQAKIIDFGIARSTELGQQTIVADSFAGKLGYVAPEQFGDFGRNIGPWTDVYSLGLTLLAVATGRAPDLGVTLVEAVERRRHGVDLSAAPPGLRPLLKKMLAPDPAHRLQTMGEVIAALDIPSGAPARPPRTISPEAAVFGRRQSDATGPARGEASTPPTTEPTLQPAAVGSRQPPVTVTVEAPARRPWPWLAVGGTILVAGTVGLAAAAGLFSRPPLQPASAKPPAIPLRTASITLAETPAPSAAPAPQAATVSAPQSLPLATAPAPQRLGRASAGQAKPNRLPAASSAAQPQAVAAPMAQAEPVRTAEEAASTAPVAAAQPDAAVQACWRAGGGRWAYLGYASRSACVAEVFHGSCQTVYGRWGQRELRRYDGKLQIQVRGLFSHWSNLGPSDCPAASPGGGQ